MKLEPEAARLVGLLETAPERIAKTVDGVTEARLTSRTDSERWSVNDILAHLRACQDVRSKLVNEMLARDFPSIRYVSPRTYIRKTNYAELPVHQSLATFAEDRAAFVRLLRGLAREQWMRAADLKGRRRETVLDCAEYLVSHETPHLEQIQALLGRDLSGAGRD